MNKKLIPMSIILIFCFLATIMATWSTFSAQSNINGNYFATGTWPQKPSVYISEVHYFPDTDHRGPTAKSNFEWLEIYNHGTSPVNLKNWVVVDNGVSRTIHRHIILPAGKRALISKAANIWMPYWEISPSGGAGYIVIELGQEIGDGLSNSGDRISLWDASSNMISAVSWGEDTTYCTLSVTPEGMSLGFKGPGLCDYENQTPTPGS